jgi:hypothetical protein
MPLAGPSLPSWPCRFDPGHPLSTFTQVDRPVRPSGEALEDPPEGPFQAPGDPCFGSIGHELVTPGGLIRPGRCPGSPLAVTTTGHAVSSRPCRAAIRRTISSTGTVSRSNARPDVDEGGEDPSASTRTQAESSVSSDPTRRRGVSPRPLQRGRTSHHPSPALRVAASHR